MLRSPDFPQKKKELRGIPVGSPFKMKEKLHFLFDFLISAITLKKENVYKDLFPEHLSEVKRLPYQKL